MSEPLHYLSLTEIAGRLARREISSLALTESMLARICKIDNSLHSYVNVMTDSALSEARAADAEIAQGKYRGVLHGVPLAVKDLCDARGVRTLAGMPRVRGDIVPATHDSTVVARLRAAGAIILGKLQLTEGAVAHHHPDVTVPVNPHHPNYWSGASSSGTGVAVAAGLCFAGLGSDTGGSIRFPSFANGVTGMKPTWGRVSRAGVFPLSWSLDHIGPLARTAADCAAMLAAIAGSDNDDPTTLRAAVPNYLDALNGDLAGVRIGFDEDYATQNVDPAIVRSLRECVEVLKAAGATIMSMRFPNTANAIANWATLSAAEAAAAHTATFPSQRDAYGPELVGFLDGGRSATAMDYAIAHDARQHFRGEVARYFEQVDVMLAPAWMRPNLTLSEFAQFGQRDEDWPDLIRFTSPFDISGTPTLSLPSGFTAEGTPFGFQLAAGHLNEAALLRAGHAWQAATHYHLQRPRTE